VTVRRVALEEAYADRPLTAAEIDVLHCAADGLDAYETGDELEKSAETVKTQRRFVLAKLGAKNMTQAVAIAFRRRILA
jgi:DNA-binding NarL/FixJ family response regulator